MRVLRVLALAVAALVLSGCAASDRSAAPSAAPATAAATATTSPTADGPLVAFYGDSYTFGMGASSPEMRWSTVISDARGWREFNPSVNGLGYVNNRDAQIDVPGEIIAADPDIVIVTMGLNDVFSYDRAADRIHEQIGVDLRRLRDELPDARIVVVEPFWYTEERPESLEVIIGWVRDAAAEIGADHIDGASRWIQGRDGEMAVDGLHPNDAGFAVIATRMDAELAALGL